MKVRDRFRRRLRSRCIPRGRNNPFGRRHSPCSLCLVPLCSAVKFNILRGPLAFTQVSRTRRGAPRMKRLNGFLVGIALATLLATSLPAQSIFGTLTGIVSDPSQSVIAGATLKLRDEQSGALRDTVTNSDGYYTFVSVPPGKYELTVTSNGFDTSKQPGIAIGGGD